MNAVHENTLNMGMSVEALLKQKQTLWQDVPAIVAAVARLSASIKQINSLSQSLNGGTTGVTEDKKLARKAMASTTEVVAGAVLAYASVTGNVELKAKVDYSAGDILRVRDTHSANLCQGIHDDAEKILDDLAEYGVTADTLAALQTKIDAYTGKVSKPRTTRSTNRASGTMLKTEFASVTKTLTEELDGLMLRFKTSQ